MEMLTKIGAFKKIKSSIFFLDFDKTKNMEPSENSTSEGSMFLVLKLCWKNMQLLIFLTPKTKEISTA